MLIDVVLPTYQVASRYQVLVKAPVPTVYRALMQDSFITDSAVCRTLIRLREFPSRLLGTPSEIMPKEPLQIREFLARSPFTLLGERENEEIVIGLVGRFWNVLDTQMTKVTDVAEFQAQLPADLGKAAMNFRLEPCGGHTRLSTETRVFFAEPYLARFRRYWLVIAPFSGLIRRIFLRNIKAAAEGRRGGRDTTESDYASGAR